MTDDTFWKVFTDTGDPMCWLMCRAADRNPPKSSEDKKRAAEQSPRPPTEGRYIDVQNDKGTRTARGPI